MEPQAAAMLAAPFAVGLAGIGPAIGISLMTSAYFNSVARQPEVQGSLTTYYFITLGVVELLGLFGFVAFYMAYFMRFPAA
ncbi:MAG: ATP synthase F0 subunit C [Candidatus Melainabacteria bacterium]|nr:ATP synthase F0 subunit C [Candidatus Melainabacteria bacterium]